MFYDRNRLIAVDTTLNFWTLVVISFGRPISRLPRSTLLSKYSSIVTLSGLVPSYVEVNAQHIEKCGFQNAIEIVKTNR
jgi:hypothetical protein